MPLDEDVVEQFFRPVYSRRYQVKPKYVEGHRSKCEVARRRRKDFELQRAERGRLHQFLKCVLCPGLCRGEQICQYQVLESERRAQHYGQAFGQPHRIEDDEQVVPEYEKVKQVEEEIEQPALGRDGVEDLRGGKVNRGQPDQPRR